MAKKAKDFFQHFFIQGLDRRRRTCYNKLLSEQTRRTQSQRRSCVYPWSCDCKTLKSKRRCYKNGKVRNHADYFTSEPSFPAELDRVYKITEGVMRSLIIAHEE